MKRLLVLATLAALILPLTVDAIGYHGSIGRSKWIGPHSTIDLIVPEPRYMPSIPVTPDGPDSGGNGSPLSIPEPGTILLVALGLTAVPNAVVREFQGRFLS